MNMECCNPFALFVWLYKCQYPVFFKIRGQRADPNKQCYIILRQHRMIHASEKVKNADCGACAVSYAALP